MSGSEFLLAEAADGMLVTILVVALGSDCDGGCSAGAGGECTCGVGVFSASPLGLCRF